MAKNDLLLVDKLLSDYSSASGIADPGKVFETFAVSMFLKDFDLTSDEVEMCIVDGKDDAGIDGWFAFVDGTLITDISDYAPRKNQIIQIVILTAKRHDTFKQQAVNNLCISVDELFDLAKDESELVSFYNEEILTSRSLLKELLLSSAAENPTVEFVFAYLSRGDSSNVAANITARSDLLVAKASEYFSDSTASFVYFGSSEILSAFRKTKDFSARVKIEESVITRGAQNYVFLVTLRNYHHFLSDENGTLKRYLFESNVRDYMGRVPVNRAIAMTLDRNRSSTEEDFWWLNNGVTIIASDANLVGKEIFLKNIQIVNGLQTSETIFNHFSRNQDSNDDRCILVKVLVTTNQELSDRIILATNNQTKVDSASLRSTDKIQRDIESILEAHGWYYDRRKNYYENLGKPRARIISITHVSFCVISLCLKEPYQCHRARPRHMYDDRKYNAIFNERWDLRVFPSSVNIVKSVEHAMLAQELNADIYGFREYASLYKFLYSTLYAMKALGGPQYTPNDLIELSGREVDLKLLMDLHQLVIKARTAFISERNNSKKLHRRVEYYMRVYQDVFPNRQIKRTI